MSRRGVDGVPRPVRFESGDTPVSRARRLNKFTRETSAYLAQVGRVYFRDLVITDASVIPAVAVPEGAVRSVTVARVVEGTVTAAPGVNWSPTSSGVEVSGFYGVAAPCRLTLRIEV